MFERFWSINERPLLQHYLKFFQAWSFIFILKIYNPTHLYNPSLKQMTLYYILAPDSTIAP